MLKNEAQRVFSNYFDIINGFEKARFIKNKLLDQRVKDARKVLESCSLCERKCGANRTIGEKGVCGVIEPLISSKFIHLGEEPEIIPSYTIFFSGCTFNCVFCQNWDISQNPMQGEYIPPQDICESIKNTKGLNVNWVGGDPTPNIAYILEILSILDYSIPQIFNSNMYLTEHSMGLLEGVIDLYLTDFKFGNNDCGKTLSGVSGYFDIISRNHILASKQADILIRHLIMPGHIECCSKPIIDWIAENLGDSVRVNIMDQYRPEYKAINMDVIDKHLSKEDYLEVYDYAIDAGLSLTD